MSYVAFRDGLSHAIFPFIGSIIIAVFSFHYYTKLGLFITQNAAGIPIEMSNFLSFLLLVVVSGLIVKLLKGVLDKIVKVEWHPVIEKFGGVVVGAAGAYIITGIVLMILALIPLSYLQYSIRERSLTGKYVLMAGPEIYGRVSCFFPTPKAPASKPSS
ncbi:MAG: CvpA family protein [Candidatus Omnitrophica bacterium]|nr:CvpA family protein [Candidatus Omnitrophota bacterium]